MKSFSLKNNDRTLNTLSFTSNAMPFLKPKLYPKNTKITFPFLYLWQKFLESIKDLFNGSKFWYLHILVHIIAIRMRYKNMLMTTRSSYNGGLLYGISELNTDKLWWNCATAHQILKFLLQRGDLSKWPTAELSSPPCLQILRIDREGMIDDIKMHGTWRLLCKKILVDSDHHEYVVTQNAWKRCSWHTVNPLLSTPPPSPPLPSPDLFFTNKW